MNRQTNRKNKFEQNLCQLGEEVRPSVCADNDQIGNRQNTPAQIDSLIRGH